jgi:hypothetical protein
MDRECGRRTVPIIFQYKTETAGDRLERTECICGLSDRKEDCLGPRIREGLEVPGALVRIYRRRFYCGIRGSRVCALFFAGIRLEWSGSGGEIWVARNSMVSLRDVQGRRWLHTVGVLIVRGRGLDCLQSRATNTRIWCCIGETWCDRA